MRISTPIWLFAFLTITLMAACGADANPGQEAGPLVVDTTTMDFSFVDSGGNQLFYDRAENTLIVEPDLDIEELAVAFCRAEKDSVDPARFSLVLLALAEGVFPFIETVERVCER